MTSGVPKKYHGGTLGVPWGASIHGRVVFSIAYHSLYKQNYKSSEEYNIAFDDKTAGTRERIVCTN